MKASVYDIVTRKIIDGLKMGNIPWKKNWTSIGGLPKNFASGRHYRGVNQLLLALNEYESPYYLTFNQVQSMGGTIKKGSSSEQVVFWKVYKKPVKTSSKTHEDKAHEILQKRFVLRYYNVFNSAVIEGIDFPQPQQYDHEPINAAVDVWNHFRNRPELNTGGNYASYSPKHDRITLPPVERFVTAEEYHKTLFHEAIHSTGHRSRLNRELHAATDTEGYSFEELIAEIGAAFLCAHAGIHHDETNTQAYINGWISFLENQNVRTIIRAASKAKKAAQYILGESLPHDQDAETANENSN
ncbi:MAG: DUF1738 domain-containing protein [Balneolaceae bacterium]|nr:DUF1738 domain-containing protein [Balneolaceae bacterium]